MKLLGIVGRVYYNRDNQDIIQIHDAVRKSMLKYDDITMISILPNSEDYNEVNTEKLDYILNKCDGFIVPGGTYFYNIDEYVINYAIKNDKPLIAFCLGFQAMCSMFAVNRDKQDMTKRLPNDNHYGPSGEYIHGINITDNTLLSSIVDSNSIMVNSVHHDYVDFEFNELNINARSDDGVLEGVEYPNKKFILGLQWHPEYLMDDNSIKILDKFVDTM